MRRTRREEEKKEGTAQSQEKFSAAQGLGSLTCILTGILCTHHRGKAAEWEDSPYVNVLALSMDDVEKEKRTATPDSMSTFVCADYLISPQPH